MFDRQKKSILSLIIFILGLSLGYFWSTNKNQPDPESAGEKKGIEVYFSQVRHGNVEAAVNNPQNIDKQLVKKIDQADQSIYAALHELDSDLIAKALIQAKERGVLTQVVTETDYMDEESIEWVQEAGILVKNDQGRGGLMHNKFIIFDEKYVWTGSFNTTYNGANKNDNNAVFIESKELAANYLNEFNEMFHQSQFGVSSNKEIAYPLISISDGTELVSIFAPENGVDQYIIDEILKSTNQLCFLIFSFTHDDIGQAMLDQAKAGVNVRGVFEKRGANTQYSEFPRLSGAGLDVRLDTNKYICHHKVIIVDDHTVLTGSFNFSQNATRTNDENLLIIRNNRQVAGQFLEEFQRIFQVATKADQNGTQSGSNSSPTPPPSESGKKINVNTASSRELQELKGVGPKMAQKIIDGRPYQSVEDLRRVKGIGEKTLEKLRDNVTVD
ncbi:MAG: hypothetical protein B6244_00220 [Candidatus Cloacimonetes bacterium 4572_55]|nr:MAG: hypothetical protein B6244_00220 [Candidatus Cloacimonetes bacterium 4572_55]